MARIDVPTIGEFCERHGGNPIRKPGDSSTHLLPDGAWYREVDDGSGTIRTCEPPDDPVERCQARRLYAQIAFNDVRGDFRELRAALKGLRRDGLGVTFTWPVKRYGPDPEDPAVALRTLHRLTVEAHAKLMLIEDELRALTRQPDDEPVERPYTDTRLADALAETELEYIDV